MKSQFCILCLLFFNTLSSAQSTFCGEIPRDPTSTAYIYFGGELEIEIEGELVQADSANIIAYYEKDGNKKCAGAIKWKRETDIMVVAGNTAFTDGYQLGEPYKFWIEPFGPCIADSIAVLFEEDSPTVFTSNEISYIDVLKGYRTMNLEYELPTEICTSNSDTIVFNVQNGIAPFTFDWAHQVEKTPFLTQIQNGDYQVKITDASGCIMEEYFRIENIISPVLEKIIVRGGKCGFDRVLAIPKVNGGTSPYSFSWSNGETDSIALGFPEGVIQVSIKDAANCEVISNPIVLEPIEPISIQKEINSVSCSEGCYGLIELEISGGESPYQITLDGMEKSKNITDLCPGIYLLNVSDVNGCQLSTTAEIKEQVQLNLNETIKNPTSDRKGQISLNPSGGLRPYTYLWNTGSTSSFIGDLELGVYKVTVTDANGCSIEEEFHLMITSLQNIPQLVEWTIFPNPIKDHLNLNIKFNEHVQFEANLLNITGHFLYKKTFSSKEFVHSIPTDDLVSGIYFFELKTEKGRVIQKIIK